jgi:hypothetical protein
MPVRHSQGRCWMSEQGEAVRRPARAPRPPRSRKRWKIAAGVAACWVIMLAVTGSLTGATVLLIVIAGLGVASVLGLRALGVTRDHPWVQRMAARPWRDGQDVLALALRHLSEVFVVTPSGTLLAPNVVDLRMHPDDLRSLGERMEPALVMSSAAEVYQEQVAEHGARFARAAPAEVRMIADPSVPPGRYRLRQGQPVSPGPAVPAPAYAPAEPAHAPAEPAYAHAGPHAYPAFAGLEPAPGGPPYRGFVGHDGTTRAHHGPDPDGTDGYGMPTVMERRDAVVPVLRLITGDLVAETRTSGARAGRGPVELALPEVPTVSREHARFTFSDGQWWIANLGMNGLTLNGQPVAGEHPVGDGDAIRWGARPDAPASRVEIG